jgi:hypothetical protein
MPDIVEAFGAAPPAGEGLGRLTLVARGEA